MTKEEAITNLKQCGILNENEQINEAYKDILIKTDIKNTNKTKLTEEQIIKAMQCVIGNSVSCSECEYQKALPFPSCRRMCAEQALDLINRKNAKIENLKQIINEQDKEILKLQKRIIFWRKDLNYQPEKIKAEAIKEFAERLKEKCYEDFQETYEMLSPYVTDDDIDDLVKEMTEDKENV